MVTLRDFCDDDLPRLAAWLNAPPVAPWFEHPREWLLEASQRGGAYRWIHHYIACLDGVPFGFCQYYATRDSGEPFDGYTALGGTYSIDYLIGEASYLRRGLGKQMITRLIARVARHEDARRVVVDPDVGNTPSRRLLLACGFTQSENKAILVLPLR